jgi:hypothetical protein
MEATLLAKVEQYTSQSVKTGSTARHISGRIFEGGSVVILLEKKTAHCC